MPIKYMRDAVQEGWLSSPLPSHELQSIAETVPGPEESQAAYAPVPAALLGKALDAVSEGSLITDVNQNVVYANKAFEAVTGYSTDEILGRNCRVLQGPGSNPETIAMMRAVLARGENFRCEILNYRKNGTPFWNGLTVSPLRDHTGTITHFVSVQRDVTSQRTLHEQLRFLALHDPVTRLPNRTALDQYLSRDHGSGNGHTAIGIIDLDDFKDVNDAYGHAAGDALLSDFADRLKEKKRDQDFLARLGGDEFVIIIPGLHPRNTEEELGRIVDNLHEAVATGFSVGSGVPVRVRMSMGLAVCPSGEGVGKGSAALRRADGILYRQKAIKSNRKKWWLMEDLTPSRSRQKEAAVDTTPHEFGPHDDSAVAAVHQEYRDRLFNGGLRMFFQPIVDLRTRDVYYLEALTRLVLEDGRVVTAADFLHLLSVEETDSLLRAGLDEALSQLTAWDARGCLLHVSVNLPPSALTNPDCALWVSSALSRHKVAPDRLTLELLESHTADGETHTRTIQELLELGVNLALDDLGAGHSTLMRLTVLPFNTVKIDRQLLLQFTTSPLKTMTFLATMIQMGQDMGWAMVAEGLEDDSLTEAMRILGVPYGQGFYLARPMPPERIPAWIAMAKTGTDGDAITTYAGALAYHWQFNRLKTPHTGTLGSCPLTPFLAAHPDRETLSNLHQQLHIGTTADLHASEELLACLVNHVTGGRKDVPALPFREPTLLATAHGAD